MEIPLVTFDVNIYNLKTFGFDPVLCSKCICKILIGINMESVLFKMMAYLH